MEQLKNMKETLMSCIQGQMAHLDTVDTKELGEAVDMVKDLSEAIYYCTITKAMEDKEENGNNINNYYTEYHYPESYNRDIDRSNGRMYYSEMPMEYTRMYNQMMPVSSYAYNGSNGLTSGNSSSNGNSSSSSRNYAEMEYPMMRDRREGRSPMSRRNYIESKEMNQPKNTQMKELEKYLQELSSDITEMVQEATPEEKAFLEKKISALASKVGQL